MTDNPSGVAPFRGAPLSSFCLDPSGFIFRFQRNLRLIVEPEVAIVDLEGQGRERSAVDPAAFRPVQAIVRFPASSLVTRATLQADELVAQAVIPARPGFASVLIKGQRGVVPVVNVGGTAIRLVFLQEIGGLDARGRARRFPGTGGKPTLRRSLSA